ncbi:MAG: Rieske 2Fe-2S domain-containing protein [Actinomycetia bacterium]|nr:Rieske 2Fe-2S domain-containing protein [Actinomycetes bacterium]
MRTAVLVDEDPWLLRRLGRLDGLRWVALDDAGEFPAVVVVDLAPADSALRVRALRARWPATVVAGFLAVPDGESWLAGQRAGCDLVANRGALVARLRPVLAAGRGRCTFPVLAEADLAGRLGLVARVPDTPVGAVVVYQVDGAVLVSADRCPHAGALLSEGGIDGRVVTCPRHGSQFDVCTGERLRGPADVDIAVFPVAVAGGQVPIVVDGGG